MCIQELDGAFERVVVIAAAETVAGTRVDLDFVGDSRCKKNPLQLVSLVNRHVSVCVAMQDQHRRQAGWVRAPPIRASRRNSPRRPRLGDRVPRPTARPTTQVTSRRVRSASGRHRTERAAIAIVSLTVRFPDAERTGVLPPVLGIWLEGAEVMRDQRHVTCTGEVASQGVRPRSFAFTDPAMSMHDDDGRVLAGRSGRSNVDGDLPYRDS